MKRIRWNADLVEELLNFVKENTAKNNISITEATRLFAEKHPEITASQAQIAYYRFVKNDKLTKNKSRSTENKKIVTNKEKPKKTGPWTEEENKTLLEMLENRGNKTMSSVFEDYSKKTGRPYKNVSQHHYLITKAKKEVKPINNDKKENLTFIDQLKMLPEEVVLAISTIVNSFVPLNKK